MTDVLGLIQMSEAIFLAPIVGGVVDLSRIIIQKRTSNIDMEKLQLLSNSVGLIVCIFLAILWLVT